MPATPTPPYTVRDYPFGPGAHPRPVKVYPTGQAGDILTPEEVALWEYIRHLEIECGLLLAKLSEVVAASTSPDPATLAASLDVPGLAVVAGNLAADLKAGGNRIKPGAGVELRNRPGK